MPTIKSVLRLQIDGGENLAFQKKESIEVDSFEQFTLSVDAVPPLKEGRKKSSKKSEKRAVQAVYRPKLSNVKFVAIYDNGQGSGLKVGIGKSKPAKFDEPFILTGRSASTLGANMKVVLVNDSSLPRQLVMLVGSDLPEGIRKTEVVKAS